MPGKVRDNSPQKVMENSAPADPQCRRSVRDTGNAPAGPILLVDDIADSRWTMTVLGDLLLSDGSGPVYPFVVATTKG